MKLNEYLKNHNFLLSFILIASFVIKLPFLVAPLTGYFGSYQVVNAMMSDMIVQSPLSEFWIPRLTILVNGQPGYHLLYFPFGSFIAAVFHLLFNLDIDFAGRLQSAVFMAINGYLVYEIALKHFSKSIALWSVFLFSFFPMNLKMGISFQNESIAVCFLLSAFILLNTKSKTALIFSGLVFSLSMIARIHFILLTPSLIVFLLTQKRSIKDILLFSIIIWIPLISWYLAMFFLYMQNGSSIMTSIFNQVSDGRVLSESMFINPNFFERVFEIIAVESMTPLAIPFILISLLTPTKNLITFLIWIGGTLSCIVLLPQKVFDHPFYLISGLPVCAFLASHVLSALLQKKTQILLFTIFFIIFSSRYFLPSALSSWDSKSIRLKKLGIAVQQRVPEDEFVIAQFETSPELLYYTKRKGWNFDLSMDDYGEQDRVYSQYAKTRGYGDPIRWLEYLKSEGAKYLVIGEIELLKTKENFYNYLQDNYLAYNIQNLNAIIYDLGKKP